MGFKKILLIITLLAILTWLFGGNIPIAQAQTVEELKTQITTLQNQINQLKTRLAEIEKEANSVAAAISKLAEKAKVKPESEYKCPDVNRDGKEDISDLTLVSTGANICQGATNFDEKRDFDGDGCVTNTDLDFVKKYFGKLTGAITQCTGIVIVPIKPESEYKCPDVNRDGKVDIVDMTLVIGSVDACTGNIKYDEKRDFDWDGCVTNTDLEYVKKYFGKLTGAITQCTGGVTLEYMEKTVASIADAIFQLTERIKGLLK